MHASAALFGYTTLLGTPLFVGGKPRGRRLLQVAARESYYLEKQRSTQRASPVLSCEMKILLEVWPEKWGKLPTYIGGGNGKGVLT